MAETDFRLSGGVTPQQTVEEMRALGTQVMHQGIGKRDRLVSNVPPEGTGEEVNSETVASGLFMQFMSQGWEQGLLYSRGSTVTNGFFTMVANAPTFADPFPKPDGNPSFTLPAFSPTVESDTSVIYSGHTWTFTENVLVKSLRIWIPSVSINSHYRIIVVTTLPGLDPSTQTIEEPVITPGEWTVIALLNELLPAGTIIQAFIDAFESSGGIPLASPWTRETDGVTAPPTGSYLTSAGRDQFRVNKTDSNGINRETPLATIGINASIIITEQGTASRSETFRTDSAAQDMGTYFLFDVTKTGQGAGGEPRTNRVSNCVFDTPTVISTEYTQELAGLANPAWGTVVPLLQFDGVDQSPLSDTAFGIDIEAEITEFSPDWNVLSFNG